MSNYFNGNGTIGFTCDVCGRELNSCSIVNGMKFCAKCYQETFGKDNQQNEIQQLKQQLEEARTRIIELEDKDWFELNIKQLEEQNDKIIQERDNIKQQLEEKDKEKTQLAIQELKKVRNSIDNLYIYSWKDKCEIGDELISSEEVITLIEKQIKKLKGE